MEGTLGVSAYKYQISEKFLGSMKHQIEYLASHKILLVETSGKMNQEGFVAMAEDILRHPKWTRGSSVIFDHKNLDFSATTFDALEGIRLFHKNHDATIGSGRSAIVVGLGRASQWEALWSKGKKIHALNKVGVFEDYREALDWATGSVGTS